MSKKAETALDGYYGRKHDTLLKIGMVVAASRGSELVVDERDLDVALKALNENEKYLPEILRCVMSTSVGDERGKVYRYISKREEVSYSDVLRAVSYCIDAKRLNELLVSLEEEEMIVEKVKLGKRYFSKKVSKINN